MIIRGEKIMIWKKIAIAYFKVLCQHSPGETEENNKILSYDIRFWGPPSLLSNGYWRALSLGLKRLGRETDLSPPSSSEVKECVELYLHSPNTSSWRGA
jgi:hypothetical protein